MSTTMPGLGFARRDSGPSPRERARRHKRESVAARKMIRALVGADHRLACEGGDQGVEALAARYGFADHDLIIVRLSVAHRHLTAIVAPARVWYSPEQKALLFKLKAELKALGRAVLLIPMRHLRRQPRLQNALLIAKSPSVQLTATDRMAVEMHLIEAGSATFTECAALISTGHPDPFGAVLSLIRGHRIEVNLNRPLSPHSLLWPRRSEL